MRSTRSSSSCTAVRAARAILTRSTPPSTWLSRRVPRGRVTTYGQIALMLGRPRGGREVGWTLHGCDDPRVPCHRVVDRTGRLAPRFGGIGPGVQRERLAAEGVRVRARHRLDAVQGHRHRDSGLGRRSRASARGGRVGRCADVVVGHRRAVPGDMDAPDARGGVPTRARRCRSASHAPVGDHASHHPRRVPLRRDRAHARQPGVRRRRSEMARSICGRDCHGSRRTIPSVARPHGRDERSVSISAASPGTTVRSERAMSSVSFRRQTLWMATTPQQGGPLE